MISPRTAGVLRRLTKEQERSSPASLLHITQVRRKAINSHPRKSFKLPIKKLIAVSPSAALSYRWFLNDFPNFIWRNDSRWFVSQATGNLYVAKAEPNDTGNYFCFTTISMDISTKSTFSRANQLTVLPNGRDKMGVLLPRIS